MEKLIKFNDEIEFRSNIFEISSISLDSDYQATEKEVSGTFIINGSFRGHELSLNQESFNKKIPFNYTFENEMDKDTVSMDIENFTYEIDQNKLCIEIEYKIKGEKMVFEDEREFDKFLESHEVEIVDLNEDEETTKCEEEKDEKEEKSEEKEEVKELEVDENDRKANVESEIMNTLQEGENTYITYHIHVCDESDTLEYLANKYKISIDIIKDYNSIDNISVGMKLIIPCQDE
mgnify:FL=1